MFAKERKDMLVEHVIKNSKFYYGSLCKQMFLYSYARYFSIHLKGYMAEVWLSNKTDGE